MIHNMRISVLSKSAYQPRREARCKPVCGDRLKQIRTFVAIQRLVPFEINEDAGKERQQFGEREDQDRNEDTKAMVQAELENYKAKVAQRDHDERRKQTHEASPYLANFQINVHYCIRRHGLGESQRTQPEILDMVQASPHLNFFVKYNINFGNTKP